MQDDHLLKVTWAEVVLAGMSSKYIHVIFRKIERLITCEGERIICIRNAKYLSLDVKLLFLLFRNFREENLRDHFISKHLYSKNAGRCW